MLAWTSARSAASASVAGRAKPTLGSPARAARPAFRAILFHRGHRQRDREEILGRVRQGGLAWANQHARIVRRGMRGEMDRQRITGFQMALEHLDDAVVSLLVAIVRWQVLEGFEVFVP